MQSDAPPPLPVPQPWACGQVVCKACVFANKPPAPNEEETKGRLFKHVHHVLFFFFFFLFFFNIYIYVLSGLNG